MDPGDAREPVAKEVRLLVPIKKSESPKRVTYGVVLEPDTEDLQGDVMTAEDIESAAYDWMERSQSGGHMHSELVEGATVVESYIAPSDIPIETAAGPEIIKKGSWVLAMRWPEEIWSSIEKGDLTGYSVGGTGVRLALEAIDKHAHHDQSTHGNWAHGEAKSPRLQAWERYLTAPTPEERRAAGDEYVRLAGEDDARGGYTGLKPDSYVTFHDGVKARIVSIHEDGAIEVESPDLPGDRSMLLLRGQIDSEGNVDLAPKTHLGPYEHTSAYGGMTPADRGVAAAGGGTPADRGVAAAAEDDDVWYTYTTQIDSQGRERQVRVAVPKEEAEWKAGYGQDASQGWEAEAGYPTFTRGQKVRTRTGQIRTVHSQRGSQVFVEEESNGWHHPSNLWPVKKNDDAGEEIVEKSLTDVVKETFRDVVAKHGHHDQSTHGNWARGQHEEGGAATIREGAKVEFANADTGTIEEIEWGSLGWPTTYRVKLDAESVGTEGDTREYLSGVKRSEIRTRRSVKKHGSGDQAPHGNWARATAETGKPYTNVDGFNMRDQPKVKRTSGGDYLETENGVQVDTRYYRNANGNAPKIHQWGPWALFPGHGIEATKNIDDAIWSNPGETLPRFMARLKPGEYVLGS